MKNDCAFFSGNNYFRYRTGGIIINDGKMLFVKCRFADYYYMIGGAVRLGETSEKCITREIFEETGMNTCVDHLTVVCENFFKGKDGLFDSHDCHVLEFYYYMKLLKNEVQNCKPETDDGEKLVWLPIEDVKTSDIKPTFIKERIFEIINSKNIIHIVEERDK